MYASDVRHAERAGASKGSQDRDRIKIVLQLSISACLNSYTLRDLYTTRCDKALLAL